MKRSFLCLLLCMTLCLTACAQQQTPNSDEPQPDVTDPVVDEIDEIAEPIDHAAALSFDRGSATAKCEVTVKTFVDGDTTHFNVPESVEPSGVLKARYLAIDTPESTGKIEEYGKKASAFTREKLENAVSIYVESDDGSWNYDSTGTRRLVWVWYLPEGESAYRNLNVELLQNGLAIASSAANNRYGSTCTAAIAQAKAQKLNVYSGQPDPDFYYGDAIELTLKQLRCHVEDYVGMKVAFEGVITCHDGSSVCVENYDEESGLYYGISVYYGYNLPAGGLDILSVGNLARIVGTVQYYEAGDVYQVSGLSYRAMKPDAPDNLKLIESGHAPAYALTDAATFADSLVQPFADDPATYPYAALTLGTTASMCSLTVDSVYTTADPASDANGAMTLFCTAEDGTAVQVRTAVLHKADGSLLVESDVEGKTVDVRGVVDRYNGAYQIKVLASENLTIY